MTSPEVELRPGAVRLRTKLGYCDVMHPVAGVTYLGIHGTAEVALTDELLPKLEHYLTADGKVNFYTDLAQVTDYDTAFRERFTHWFRRNRGAIPAVHALVGSGLVMMGIGIANLVLGGLIHPYRDRGDFEAALGKACRLK